MEPSTRAITIEEFIECKPAQQASYNSLSLFEKDENGDQFLLYNLINDYYDEIMEIAVTVTLTDEEYFKYRLRPKLLAYRLYGDPEMFYVLLLVNNISNIKDFDFKTLKAIRPVDLHAVLSSVLSANLHLLSKKGWK